MGQSEEKRAKCSRQRGDTSQSTERKKGKVDCRTISGNVDGNIGASGQDLEGAEPVQGPSEMSGAAPGAGGEVEMTGVDGGIKGSDGIEEDEGKLSDSWIISDISVRQGRICTPSKI